MMWSMRIGAMLSNDELEPRDYQIQDGSHVRRLLSVAPPPSEYEDILATWTYEDEPVLGIELKTRPGKDVLTKEYTELNGVVRAYGAARIRGLNLSAGRDGEADLRAHHGNEMFYIECTQVRANGELFAMLRLVEEALLHAAANDGRLAKICQNARFTVGFVDAPGRQVTQHLAAAVVASIIEHDWSQGDLKVLDPALSQHVAAVTRFIGNADKPIKCAQLVNGVPAHDYVELILNAIETKKAKRYANGPLELAITAIEEFGAVIPRLAKIDIDPGQFRRIVATDTQDVVVYECR